ncbi:helix-turn-helix transcriptional regulator [Brevibacillus centrosporus]|uniref:helix-turn-helix transcriptional regulator n=1 Tax=Brevibacillus centrosporus TaxID=54910 RepID=UPI00398688A0
MSKAVLGNNIASIRKRKKITQQELADAIGMERTSLSQIETGRYCPRAETMKKISDYLKEPLGEIFFNPSVLNVETTRQKPA